MRTKKTLSQLNLEKKFVNNYNELNNMLNKFKGI